jgi:fumarate reductase flavoprotein subunit
MNPSKWDEQFDVVVMGAGAAGMEAAIEAADTGASVIVFEKQQRILDSSTAIAVGQISLSRTDLQKSCGVEDSDELFFNDIMEMGKHKNDPILVRTYLAHQLDTYRQLTSLGITWSPTVGAMAGMSVPRGHLTDSIDLVRTLKRALDARKVPVVFQTPVKALITDQEGAVVGATIQQRTGTPAHIRAYRGVVLASGGFARDPDRLRAIDPRFSEVMATSGIGHTGDGLRMGEALGADIRDTEYVQPSFELHASGGTSDDIVVLFYQGGIIVNRRGERFVNESISYKDIAGRCLDQPGKMAFQIFDRDVYDKALEEQARAGHGSPMALNPSKIRLLGKGDSIESLADNAGIPPSALQRTIQRYNDFVSRGSDDDFGRSTLSGNYGKPMRIERAPFYAFATISHMLATYGGLAVDGAMRVLRNGVPIPGLYAAGEVVGGFHGASYHSGTGLGKALIFGRVAGKSAAMRARHVAR